MANRLAARVSEAFLMVFAVGSLGACSPSSNAADRAPIVEASAAHVSQDARGVAAPAEMPVLAPTLASASGFSVKGVLRPEQPLRPRDYLWEPEGVPAGPMTIVIDIEARLLYAYRGGVEIGRSYVIYGADDKPTPVGTFKILQKNKDHVSNLYDAEMPYMMRLTWDGIAIHGAEVDDEYATHGCIGIPDEFAAMLFEQIKLGDQVMVMKGWMPEPHGPELQPNAYSEAAGSTVDPTV